MAQEEHVSNEVLPEAPFKYRTQPYLLLEMETSYKLTALPRLAFQGNQSRHILSMKLTNIIRVAYVEAVIFDHMFEKKIPAETIQRVKHENLCKNNH